jgi:hypothetical protein
MELRSCSLGPGRHLQLIEPAQGEHLPPCRGLGQLHLVLAATAGLYLLARSMAAFQAIAASPLAEDSATQQLARWGVEAVAFVLPRLDAVTRTEWLVYAPPEPRAYLQALAGLVVYGALLVAAGLFDFHRENF